MTIQYTRYIQLTELSSYLFDDPNLRSMASGCGWVVEVVGRAGCIRRFYMI